MKVLDLFSGLGGWSAAFRDRGHEVITIDNNHLFNPTYCRNVAELTDLTQFGKFDVILASPPCQAFSIASVYLHWKDHKPDNQAKRSIALVQRTLELIEMGQPKFWVMENPRGMLRKVIGKPQAEVSFCQYGTAYMKPTDLWGFLPPSFIPKNCKPKRNQQVACPHEEAPRGAKTGIQGIGGGCPHLEVKHKANEWGKRQGVMSSSWVKKQSLIASTMRAPAMRALIPYNLSLAMCLAAEKDLGVFT